MPDSHDGVPNMFCQKYKVVSWNAMGSGIDDTICLIYTANSIRIKDTTYTNLADFKQAMQGQYLYYELATPITKIIDGNEKAEQIDDSLTSLGKCKNLLNPTLQTTTINGVTCTNNGDGTITLNGTASANATFRVVELKIQEYLGKTLRLVGCPKNGSATTYHMFFTDNQNSNSSLTDSGEGATKIVEQWGSSEYWICYITIVNGVTVSNLVFKPMLTTNLNATYDDFVPYTGEGDTLSADVAEIKDNLDKLNSLPIGSIIQIEAAKDNIETTKEKYGWQYLGTSNIEYERGSANILVTNVYRKNN